jgi:uncharacterized DUF497 family protein
MHWDWDPEKNRTNLIKHGITFETATRVFLDPFAITGLDRYENGEERWKTVGMISGLMVIVVAHTVADDEDGIEGRIISARHATQGERKWYEQERLRDI